MSSANGSGSGDCNNTARQVPCIACGSRAAVFKPPPRPPMMPPTMAPMGADEEESLVMSTPQRVKNCSLQRGKKAQVITTIAAQFPTKRTKDYHDLRCCSVTIRIIPIFGLLDPSRVSEDCAVEI